MNKVNIVIASLNPVKIEAVKEAFVSMFTDYSKQLHIKEDSKFNFIPTTVTSGVPDQPIGDKQTLKGAATRAVSSFKLYTSKNISKGKGVPPHYTVGIEGGIDFTDLGAVAFAYVYIRDNKGTINYTKTTPFLLPPKVAELLAAGKELGEADDIVFNKSNSKQKEGAIGILTKGLIDRKAYYVQALKICLIPFVNEELFKKEVPVTPKKPCRTCG